MKNSKTLKNLTIINTQRRCDRRRRHTASRSYLIQTSTPGEERQRDGDLHVAEIRRQCALAVPIVVRRQRRPAN